ncbi:hypothetical protein CONPUDRAFT_80442, partial [Coniophora puteana RWD-64-598 SS2]
MENGDSSHQNANAIAGPSTITQDTPMFFFPPQPGAPPPPTHLRSTHDLITRFNLLAAYDKYVRQPPASGTGASDEATADKGKGRAPSPTPGPGAAAEDERDGEKKKKNTYRHLIKGVPGKHSMKKDDYLTTIMQVPPKQRIPIVEFDAHQREAFTVSPEGLKGWNASALILESAQAREDRKRRKELKKLAKAQAQGLAPGAPMQVDTPGGPLQAPGTNLPQPPPEPQSTRPRMPSVQIPPTRVNGTPTPTGARPPQSAVLPRTSTPLSAAPGQRGTKRAMDDGGGGTPLSQVVSNGPIMAASANGVDMGVGMGGGVGGSGKAIVGPGGVRARPM